MKKCLLILGLLMWMNAQAAEVYRSIDNNGKVHYGDSPLQGTDDVEELKIDKAPTPNIDLPYETRQAMKNFPVTLYTFEACGSSCQMARDFLVKRGIPYTEKSLVTEKDIDAYRKASGDNKYPGLTIGQTWLKGFQPEQWGNELDFAGYPKNAIMYRPPASAPSAQPAQ
jgi:Domain of unknown function (DUF4124)